MLCINPFCCPLKECLLEHHDQRLISPTLTVCEDFPRCHNLDCALYHPRRIAMTVHADKDCRAWACPMLHRSRKCFRPACDCPGIHRPTSPSPLNTLCESLLFSIAEFLVLPDALALYAASHAIHQNRRAALIPRDIRFFRRRKSIFWEPVRKVVHQRVHASYPRKKKSVCVVVECGEYVHHRFEVSSIHEWTQHFSRDVRRPSLVRRDRNRIVCDLGRRRDVRPDRLDVGTKVDAMDHDGVWYEAVVVGLTRSDARIHFDGWNSRFDLWLPRRSPAIAVRNTFTPVGWRERLTVGQEVAFRKNDLWHHGTVVERDGERIVAGNGRSFLETTVSDTLISLPGCHIFSARNSYEYRWAHQLDRVLARWPAGDRAIHYLKTGERGGYELFFA